MVRLVRRKYVGGELGGPLFSKARLDRAFPGFVEKSRIVLLGRFCFLWDICVFFLGLGV